MRGLLRWSRVVTFGAGLGAGRAVAGLGAGRVTAGLGAGRPAVEGLVLWSVLRDLLFLFLLPLLRHFTPPHNLTLPTLADTPPMPTLSSKAEDGVADRVTMAIAAARETPMADLDW